MSASKKGIKIPLSLAKAHALHPPFANVVQAQKQTMAVIYLHSKIQSEYRQHVVERVLTKTMATLSILRPLPLPSIISPHLFLE